MNITVFLISWSFGILASFSLLRFIMQLTRADFYNPVAQLLSSCVGLRLFVAAFLEAPALSLKSLT